MNLLQRLFKPKHASTANLCEVSNLQSNIGEQIIAIYEQSFPEAERDPVENIAASLSRSTDNAEIRHLRAFMDQETVVGFTYFTSYREYYLGYLKFIAVRADIRGKGYGPILLQDAIQQLRADGIRATGWPYLGLVFEVERPETAENEADRLLRERRIEFHRRNGAMMIEEVDYVAPPVSVDQPSLPFHLMVLRAVPKYRMQRWLRQKAVKALLIEGYGENPESWFVRHALEVRQRARQSS